MNRPAKYLEALNDEDYREEFERRLERIRTLPHISEEIREDLVDDIIIRFDRKNGTGEFTIEGSLTRRRIESAWQRLKTEPTQK